MVEVYAAEFVWSSKAKPHTCNAFKWIGKNCDEEMKFAFDKIFDALPQATLLEYHILHKYHNSFSHATNECNVFQQQIQSAIND